MTDAEKREKVIRGLECHVNGHPHTRCHKCPYWGTGPHGASECNDLAAGALALLKAQEPVSVKKKHMKMGGLQTWNWVCGNCDQTVLFSAKFCPWCGRPVKWND